MSEPDNWYQELRESGADPEKQTNGRSGRKKPPSGLGHQEDKTNKQEKTSKVDKSEYVKPPPPSSKNVGGQEEELKWKALLFEYSQSTSLHGVRFIAESSRFVLRRILWFFILAAALGFFIYYMYTRVDYFLQYNKNVNVEVNYLNQVRFPPVTFCNQNPFRMTPVAKYGWYDMIKKYIYTSAASGALTPNLLAMTQFYSLIQRRLGLAWKVQPYTWDSDAPGYIGQDDSSVCLYHDGSKWILALSHKCSFGDKLGNVPTMTMSSFSFFKKFAMTIGRDQYRGSTVYGFVADPSLNPLNITSSDWTLKISGVDTVVSGVSFTCTTQYMGVWDSTNASIINGLSLGTMYDIAGPEKEDFIQNCVWKGSQCLDSDITVRHTDMGKCYTFISSDMFIEQSGPGFGLSLTANIEQYEYTQSTDEGIGIKLLMHESDDVPLMKERGTAVSPGLYSFISVETTQVENLPPDWGTCGTKPLDYYPEGNYSIARCKVDCETEFVANIKGCDCRDYYMPDVGGSPSMCDVGAYVECAKPAIDNLRAAGNYCSCPTPCITDTYVPTTSFSIVLSEVGETQDNKTLQLKEKLIKARETTYRVVQDKYKETMRVFHLLQQGIQWMSRFGHASLESLEQEHTDLKQLAVYIQADCIAMRNTISDALTHIEENIYRPIIDFSHFYTNQLTLKNDELQKMLHTTENGIKSNPASYVTEASKVVWNMYSALRESMKVFKDNLQPDLYNEVNSMSTISTFRIKDTLIDDIIDLVGKACTWCTTSSSQSILSKLKNEVRNRVNSNLASEINRARQKLENAYDPYLVNLAALESGYNVDDREDYDWYIGNVTTSLRSGSELLESALEFTREAMRYLTSLYNFAWDVKCQAQFPKVIAEYETNHIVIKGILEEMTQYLDTTWDGIDSDRLSYINGNLSLEAVGNGVKFSEIKSTVNGKKVRLDSSLNDRLLGVEELRNQMDSMNYVFSMLVTNSYMVSNSMYWQKFGITAPSFDAPGTTNINGINVPNSDYRMQQNAAAKSFWQGIEDDLTAMVSNLQRQYDLLSSEIANSEVYFDDYIEGNSLNSAFYTNNFLQVELFYKELTERKVSQQKAYEFANLLSELGGLMGLLLGASVLSIFEIIDLCVYNFFRKVMKSRDDKVKPSSEIGWN
ncbi:hypothetical protein CAPTEDRAFT_204744 [Capitella teleta]|uniref:Uncharacterized protein n=1 Tax=Capitella teleta TaxID=283909 RepID=R7V049_CAPTE|nr:hypothetical protein CAPTEDRAFT_204744 [Capitella teleta]|eukprot:ELU12198.1 hypothetical protein CAPTEDRAFT_204744 [Capitella teleta]